MLKSSRRPIAILVALALLVPSILVAAQVPSDPFVPTWERTDLPVESGQVSRTWMWGPFDSAFETMEPYVEAPDGERKVAYFDKSRMEITDPSADQSSIWYVTNGLLTIELITGRMQLGHDTFEQHEPAELNVAGDPEDLTGPTYATFSQLLDEPPLANGATITQRINRNAEISDDQDLGIHGVTAAHLVQVPGIEHQVASVFWDFMNSSGVVFEDESYTVAPLFQSPFYATGYPITEAYWANVAVGGTYQDVLIQCFERRCLTFNPLNEPGWQVEAGNVGQHYYHWRYTQVPGTPDPTPTPAPTSTPEATLTPPVPVSPSPGPTSTPDPVVTPGTAVTPDPTSTPVPDPSAAPDATSTPVPDPTGTPGATSTPDPDPTSTPGVPSTPDPSPTFTPTPGGEGDTTPPELVEFSFQPSTIDSATGGTITFTVRLTDDLSGVAAEFVSVPPQVHFRSPSGTQTVSAAFSSQERVSGTPLDGVYEYETTVPAYSEHGVWEVSYFMLVDQVGNYVDLTADDLRALGFPTTFEVTGTGDITPPELVEFSFQPSTIDSATGGTITFTARLTDDLSGVAAEFVSVPPQVHFRSPSGTQTVSAAFSSQERVSGTPLDGVYEYETTVPVYSEHGVWEVSYFMLVDQVGNYVDLTADDLRALGFPTTFEVR